MNGFKKIPAIDALKEQAKQLRNNLAPSDQTISHSAALEQVAKTYGCKDWNTLRALSQNQSEFTLAAGDTVSGFYLGAVFTGQVLLVEEWSGGRFRLKLDLDEAVDVVKFDSFSAFRKRINCVVFANGETQEKTSDGIPHVRLTIS